MLPAREEIDKSILKHVGKKWRGYRYELKVQFKKPDRTQEQVASIVPKGLDASEWKTLVQYWFSERSQVPPMFVCPCHCIFLLAKPCISIISQERTSVN